MAKQLKNTLLSTVILFILCVELYSLLPSPPHKEAAELPHTVSGAIHVHTPKGLRTHPYEWLKEPAQLAGLDFIVAVAPDEQPLEEGRFGTLDFFVEDDVALSAGELLVFHSHGASASVKGEALKRLASEVFEGRATPQEYFSVISHPSHVKNPWNRFDRFTDGIEIINFDSQWVRLLYDSPFSFLGAITSFPFNQFLATLKFLQPHPKDLVNWDNMNALGPGHFGIASHDLNFDLQVLEGGPLHAALLEKTFKTAQNVLFLNAPLSSDFSERKKQIYKSIREGRSAILVSLLYPFVGNDWALECEGMRAHSGDQIALKSSCQFLIKSPRTFPFERRFKLFRDGELVNEFSTNDPEYRIPVTERGAYRLEVWAKTHTLLRALLANDTPYILYNPIFVN